jgi:VWFA-related protein
MRVVPWFVIALPVLSLFAQEQPAPSFSTGVKVVNILATVRDKGGKIVSNLTQSDFALSEDGQPREIHYFARETDLPLTLGLLVDTSMSERRSLPVEKDASERFLNEMLRGEKDRAFLIHFDREVELLQDVTPSRQKLESAIGLLDVAPPAQWGARGGGRGHLHRGGGTSLYDAVLLASEDLMLKQSGRKALVILSDGEDNASKVSLEQAVEAAQRSDCLVYSIPIKDEQGLHPGFGNGRGMGRMGGYGGRRGGAMRERPDGKKILERISKETGGRFFEVSKKQSADRIYAQIQEELRNQYSLGFSPDKGESAGYHKITLAAKRKGLEVRSRDGYYSGASAN